MTVDKRAGRDSGGPEVVEEHDERPLLQVVVGSTRPGRVGSAVAGWLHERAVAHGAFAVELVDLALVDLPLLDEPNHPRLQRYTHPHTKAWSAIVSRADAFVFVTPEYNHSFPAALKNALDFLSVEWASKPAGIASYGGVSAGLRAATALKPVLSALRMVTVPDSVSVPFVAQHLVDGTFRPDDIVEVATKQMLETLGLVAPLYQQVRQERLG